MTTDKKQGSNPGGVRKPGGKLGKLVESGAGLIIQRRGDRPAQVPPKK